MGRETKNTAEGGVKMSLTDVKIPTLRELQHKNPIEIIDISQPRTQGSYSERRTRILNSVDEIISKPYFNIDKNTLIFLTKKSYEHAFHNSGEMQINAAEHLPEFIENAILTHKEDVTHGRSMQKGYIHFLQLRKPIEYIQLS